MSYIPCKIDPQNSSYSFKQFIENLGSKPITVEIDDEIVLHDDVTIPENICLKFTRSGKLIVDYYNQQFEETIAVSDGSTTNYTYTLSEKPVSYRPNIQLEFTLNGETRTITLTPYNYTYNSTGISVSISIDSETGELNLNFSVAPDNGTDIKIRYYRYCVLTINGSIEAGLWQIFDGNGVITGNPKIEAVYPEWFGNDLKKALALKNKLLLTGSSYTLSDDIYLSDFTWIEGTVLPTSDPIKNQEVITILRTANVSIHIVSDDRVNDRRVGVLLEKIKFVDNGSYTTPLLTARYADSVVLRDCCFSGIKQVVYAEECWDWRIENCIFKNCGDTSNAKSVVKIYNGDHDSSNDWQLINVRFQENEYCDIEFDSSGLGSPCAFFWFTQCKFEDTAATIPTHIKGNANKVYFMETQFAGCSRTLVQVDGEDWCFVGCAFANANGEFITINNSRCNILQTRFQSAGTVSQYVTFNGHQNVIKDSSIDDASIPMYVNNGSENKIINVRGFRTKQRGVATISSGTSNVWVTFSVDRDISAEHITITPYTSLGGATCLFVGSIDNENKRFQVFAGTDSSPYYTTVEADVHFAWMIDAEEL